MRESGRRKGPDLCYKGLSFGLGNLELDLELYRDIGIDVAEAKMIARRVMGLFNLRECSLVLLLHEVNNFLKKVVYPSPRVFYPF